MSVAPLSIWKGDALVAVLPAPRPAGVRSVTPSEATLNATIDAVLPAWPGVTRKDIKSLSRVHRIAHARHEVMWCLREMKWDDGVCRYSLPGIARALGLKDHTSVYHGVRAHARRLAAS